jgi:2Fe-2S ferredoxin
MPQLIFLPHERLCPEGAAIEVPPGISICDAALEHGIAIEHACEKSCACTTCHVYIREGGESLNEASDNENDMLDKAWGLDPDSRLSCQTIVGNQDLIIELPKYTINLVSEHH